MGDYEEKTQRQAFLEKYEADVMKLARYIPYFMDKGGKDVARDYDGQQGHSSIAFPVYDGTLMSFVREAQNTGIIDRNYVYAYTRRRIRTGQQEISAIENAGIKDDDLLRGVISKYVLEGMRKTGVWQTAVERQLFLKTLVRFKDLIEESRRY